MERQQAEIFLALADELHFGRTATRLNLAQSRVSEQVRALEHEIGGQLFVRTSRRVQLTSLGADFRAELEPAHRAVAAAVSTAQAAARGTTGILRVAFLGPVAGDLILDVAREFRSVLPGVAVEIHETHIADPAAPVRDGAAELVLTQLPIDEAGLMQGPTLIEERRVLAIASSHPLAARASISMDDLAATRILLPPGPRHAGWMGNYQPWKTPGGSTIERGPVASTFLELLSLVAAGHGACTVAEHNVRHHPRRGVTYVPIHDAEPFQFGFVWRAELPAGVAGRFASLAITLVTAGGGPVAFQGRPSSTA